MQNLAYQQITAKSKLPSPVWDYLSHGDHPNIHLPDGTCQWVPRPLRALQAGHTRLTCLGEAWDVHPIALAPVAYQRLFHADAEIASALAASAQGGQSIVSSLSSTAFSHITHAVGQMGGKPPWFKLYWQGNRERT